ncbi:MFS transporter [bacterium]|nr:MFS transporter [bacterium]
MRDRTPRVPFQHSPKANAWCNNSLGAEGAVVNSSDTIRDEDTLAAPSVVNRAAVVDRSFLELVSRLEGEPFSPRDDPEAPVREGSLLTARTAVALFQAMVESRHLDFAARVLKAQGAGYYTIGSSGHETNAVLGELLRLDDWCFLHYRSGALVIRRAGKLPGQTPIFDTCLSYCASSDDPISGGRHKVWGSLPLRIPPQTSTIASQLPKAVGCAVSLERRRRLGLTPAGEPEDSISVVSFGDASLNHAVATTAFNAALWTHHQRLPCPVLFVCEDNGIGISVPTPAGWIESQYGKRDGLHYVASKPCDLASAYDAALEAIETCRYERRPVFLHLRCVRLLAHAGSDVETEYHSLDEIEREEARDPLLRAAELLVQSGTLPAGAVRSLYEDARTRVAGAACEAASRPRLETAEEVMAPLAPSRPERTLAIARALPDAARRAQAWGGEERLPERGKPRHLAAAINAALSDLLVQHENAIVFGEDVGKKGGVYHVTADLQKIHGKARVFDTLLDETSILGLAIGAAHVGLLPIPEIQYLAYYHNAEDQIRGEAGSLSFFSKGQFQNGLVVRIQGLGYQKGFGGHFHNDDAVAVLRDVPGLVLGVPSRPDAAVEMLRACVAAASLGRVCAFLEPIALYMQKDLHVAGDGGWLAPYPAPGRAVSLGEGAVVREHERPDLVVLTYGNGVFMALRAARRLEAEGVRARVVDLRWLLPIDRALCLAQAREVGRVLVLDECRRTAGPSEEILAAFVEESVPALCARVTARDTYVPLGPAANLVLPSEDDVLKAARGLARDVGLAPAQALGTASS